MSGEKFHSILKPLFFFIVLILPSLLKKRKKRAPKPPPVPNRFFDKKSQSLPINVFSPQKKIVDVANKKPVKTVKSLVQKTSFESNSSQNPSKKSRIQELFQKNSMKEIILLSEIFNKRY